MLVGSHNPYREAGEEASIDGVPQPTRANRRSPKALRKDVVDRAFAGEFTGNDVHARVYNYCERRAEEIVASEPLESIDIEVAAFGKTFTSALEWYLRDLRSKQEPGVSAKSEKLGRGITRAKEVLEKEQWKQLQRSRESAEREHLLWELAVTAVAVVSVWRLFALASNSAMPTMLISTGVILVFAAGKVLERIDVWWRLETEALFLLHRRLDQLSPPSEEDEVNSRFYDPHFWDSLGSRWGSPGDPARMLLRGKDDTFGRSHFATKMLAVQLGPHVEDPAHRTKAKTVITLRRLVLIPYALYHLALAVYASF